MKEPRDEPLNVAVLDVDYAERRDGDAIVPMRERDRCAIRQQREDYWEAICDRYAEQSTLTLDQFNDKIERTTQEILRKFGH